MLSAAESRTLSQICETLVPRTHAPELGSLAEIRSADLELAALLEQALQDVSSPGDLSQVRVFLAAIQTPAVNWILSGRWAPFSSLGVPERTELLLSWGRSRIGLRRKAFQGLKRLALFLFYASLTDKRPDLSQELFEYMPLAKPAQQDDSPIELLPIERSTDLECDVVVVGSGAGGATAAARLAEDGYSVVVLEKGGYFSPADYHGRELQANQELFENSGALTTSDLAIVVLAGSALGGGTIVNWSTSLPTPPEVRRQWQHEFGFAGVEGKDYDEALEVIQGRLHVNRRESEPNPQNQALERGAVACGLQVEIIPRNVHGCQTCDFCTFGCRFAAKKDSLQTSLRAAHLAGARIVARARVERVLVEGGIANGVVATLEDAGRPIELNVRSKAVVVAAGSIHTPLILLRSGLRNRNIGANLRLHPVSASFALHDEPIHSWRGRPQTRMVDTWSDLDGQGYGVRLEVAPAHPGLWASALPWTSGARHKDLMASLPHLANIIAITRDRGSGRVFAGRDGRPVLSYQVSPIDKKHMMRGLLESMRIHAASGAIRIYSPHTEPLIWRQGMDLDKYLGSVEDKGLGPNQSSTFSAHQLGTCRIAGDPSLGAVKPNGETYEVEGLYVADGSVFPTSCGVNPMIPISATSYFLAGRIARKLA